MFMKRKKLIYIFYFKILKIIVLILDTTFCHYVSKVQCELVETLYITYSYWSINYYLI